MRCSGRGRIESDIRTLLVAPDYIEVASPRQTICSGSDQTAFKEELIRRGKDLTGNSSICMFSIYRNDKHDIKFGKNASAPSYTASNRASWW
jgi:hypothetical protein